MKIKGLKCDNPGCNYRDDTILREEYEKYINHPCPLCGHPILTQADYDALIDIEKIENNPIIKFIKIIENNPTIKHFFPSKKIIIKMHGDGWKNLEIKEEK